MTDSQANPQPVAQAPRSKCVMSQPNVILSSNFFKAQTQQYARAGKLRVDQNNISERHQLQMLAK